MRSSTDTSVSELHVSVERLTADDFSKLAQKWQDVLESSDADPLFMSWPWLFSWWEI
jgi:hypothetical protein